MIHAVVRTDLMDGTDVRAALVSAKYIVTTTSGDTTVKTPTAIDNGNVLKLGGLYEGREIFEGMAPAKDTALDDIVLVASPEVMYDERKRNLEDFENPADVALRGYRLRKGNIFSVTAEGLELGSFTADTAKGKLVELQAGTKLKVVASATSGSTKVGEVIDVEVAGPRTFFVIEVK